MASADAKDCDPSELAATQAREILVEVPADANTEPTHYWCPDTPADEMTLSIDHIREQLFSLLTPEDLFNCRRLNRMWNSYATVELQERLELKCTIKEENLGEYLNLLQNHQEIFPCLPLPIFRKYSFEKATLDILSDPMLQQFLSTYGYFVRDLSLNQNMRCHSYMLPKEKDVMEQVRSLLIHSAPNLASLSMCGIDLKVGWKKPDLNRYQDSRRPLRTTDPEFAEIHSIPGMDKNKNFKFFSFKPIISGKIFELAVQLAPNLEEIQVLNPSLYGQEHKYFIEPLNRLRFCKDMHYSADSSELFKKFADLAQEGNLKLRDISFMFGKGYFDSSQPPFWETDDDEDVGPINKLLACSWDSLETVEWRWVMEVPGLKWPDVMPNVWRIDLGPYHYTLVDGLLAFPPNFIWSKTFPKLRHIHICEKMNSWDFPELLRCFQSQCIDSVEEVHVFEQNSEERDSTTLAYFEQLRRLFPSAQFVSTWPFTEHEDDEDLSS